MHLATHILYIGFVVHPPGAVKPFRMTAHVVGCSCDLPAKAILRNFIQFYGAYRCGYCEQSGQSLSTEGGGNVRVFPYVIESPKGEQRTKEACLQYADCGMCMHVSKWLFCMLCT